MEFTLNSKTVLTNLTPASVEKNINIGETVNHGERIDEPAPVVEPPGAMPDPSNRELSVQEPVKQIQEIQTEIPPPMPDRSNKPAYKAWLFKQISALKSYGFSWAEITRQFNTGGVVTLTGSSWGRSTIQAFYTRELENLTKKTK